MLFGVYGLILILLLELAAVDGDHGQDAAWLSLTPGWIALLAAFFVWAPRLLTHDLIRAATSAREPS